MDRDGEPARAEQAGPAELRLSDAERDQVAELLRRAAGEGRLGLDELDERLEAAFRAKVYADLVPLLRDLPVSPPHRPGAGAGGHAGAGPGAAPVRTERHRHLALLSGLSRAGAWTVPERMTVTAVLGAANLDLRNAELPAAEVVLTLNAVMGGVTVVVGPHTDVIVEGTGVMGGFSGPSRLVPARLDDTSPTVRVRGFAFWGGVSVERKQVRRPR